MSLNSPYNLKCFRQDRRENQNTYFIFNNPLPENRVVYEKVRKYGRVRQATDDNIIRRMFFACRIIKGTDTEAEYLSLTYLT